MKYVPMLLMVAVAGCGNSATNNNTDGGGCKSAQATCQSSAECCQGLTCANGVCTSDTLPDMTGGGPDAATASKLHNACLRAVRLIVSTQNDEGGWRYNPVPYDADVSVTICQIMALRSARNAGLEVPKDVIDKAVAYVRRCQNEDGGFRYQQQQPPSAWERSAASVASLQYAGVYDDKAIRDGLGYVSRFGSPGRLGGGTRHYYYGHYYAVQAMYLAGGDWWQRWWPAVRDELLERQHEDGFWPDSQVGPQYGTAMALIILQMPKRYLPIFQK